MGYTKNGGPGLLVRPSTSNSRGVLVSFKSNASSFRYRTQGEQKKIISDYLRDGGWQCDRVIMNLDWDSDLYLGPLLQIKAQTWSKGRFVLLGDAGYSPSVLTGRGTTLAIAGAYVLAGELAKTDDIDASLRSYEAIFKPFAEACQVVPPGYLDYLEFREDADTDSGAETNFAIEEPQFDLPDYVF